MRFVPGFGPMRLSVFAVTLVSTLSPALVRASSQAEGSSALRPAGRLVATAPGIEIRADEYNYHTVINVPVSASGWSMAAPMREDFATTTHTAVVTPGWRPLPLYGGSINAVAVSPVDR